MGMVCPYCDIEVSESAVEAEDGCCPECGAMITHASLFGDDDTVADYDDMADDDDLESDDMDIDLDDIDDFDDDDLKDI